MKTRIDLRLVEEARAFALRFACEDCAHFVSGPEASGAAAATSGESDELGRCSHGYPPEPRRRHLERGEDARGEIVFCKEFDLA